MTLKQRLADLTSGWPLTLRKLSMKVSAIEVTVMGFLWTVAAIAPWWLIPVAYVFFFIARTLAANVTQERVATFDPTKYRLVPIDGSDA